MIDPKSLRIGNRLQEEVRGHKQEFIVAAINYLTNTIIDTDDNITSIDYLEPIPLSPSLLERAGFKNITESIFENSINPYWVKDAICLLYNKTDTRNIFLPGIGFTFNGKYYVGHDSHWIESFHELQNFYKEHKHKELELKP